ncbi:hypothetical protein JL100_018455 [Skermanella mucosa]|uniref:hypothetical protein n=1 Tax=Skermanella mucosa TaxID=1789672 RepID=UPI00192AE6E3|nr:hypothetical protein [Skermanella mucosa]UEM19069.1 hypothetical protein JL100_018455 [Skermanella mucosa]
MIEFDQLVETLRGHFGVAGDAVSEALASLDGDHLEILTRNLDPDEVVRMLEAAGMEAEELPPGQLADVLETLAEAVSEVAEETGDRKPASARGEGA